MKSTIEYVKAQCKPNTPEAIIKLIARQLIIAEQAAERIEIEGIVVRDLKGGVIEHPAIKIEANATKLAAELITKNKATRPANNMQIR